MDSFRVRVRVRAMAKAKVRVRATAKVEDQCHRDQCYKLCDSEKNSRSHGVMLIT